jgi:hypothetical protein
LPRPPAACHRRGPPASFAACLRVCRRLCLGRPPSAHRLPHPPAAIRSLPPVSRSSASSAERRPPRPSGAVRASAARRRCRGRLRVRNRLLACQKTVCLSRDAAGVAAVCAQLSARLQRRLLAPQGRRSLLRRRPRRLRSSPTSTRCPGNHLRLLLCAQICWVRLRIRSPARAGLQRRIRCASTATRGFGTIEQVFLRSVILLSFSCSSI